MASHHVTSAAPVSLLQRATCPAAVPPPRGPGKPIAGPPEPRSEVAARIQDMARRAFQLLGGEGLSRVDFFYLEASGQLILNEVNTMPGMTPFSLYPGMWANAGLSYRDLVTELIELALAHPQGLR